MSVLAAALLLAASGNCGPTANVVAGLDHHGEAVVSQFVDDAGTAWRFWYDYKDGSYTITYTDPTKPFISCMYSEGTRRVYRET